MATLTLVKSVDRLLSAATKEDIASYPEAGDAAKAWLTLPRWVSTDEGRAEKVWRPALFSLAAAQSSNRPLSRQEWCNCAMFFLWSIAYGKGPREPMPLIEICTLAIQEKCGGIADSSDVLHLAGETLKHLRRIAFAIGVHEDHLEIPGSLPESDEWEPPARDGMLWADAEAATALANIGENGKEAAEGVRRAARIRWSDYQSQHCLPLRGVPRVSDALWGLYADHGQEIVPAQRIALVTAVAVWLDVVKPQIERAKKKPPALPQLVLQESIAPSMRAGNRIIEGRPSPEDGSMEYSLVSREGVALCAVRPMAEIPVEVLYAAAAHLGGLTAHRLLRYEVTTAHRQYMREETNPHVLRIQGGWHGLAKAIGATSNQADGEVEKLVKLQACKMWDLPGNRKGNLLTVSFSPTQKRGPASEIVISLGEILLPDFVYRLPRGTANREHRQLIPVLSQLPPRVGPAIVQGAQASLQWALLAEMRRRARELCSEGGIAMTEEQWTELAEGCGLHPKWLSVLLERWQRDGKPGDVDQEPAFIRQTAPGRWTLTETYRVALDFMREGAQKELDGKRDGLKHSKRKK